MSEYLGYGSSTHSSVLFKVPQVNQKCSRKSTVAMAWINSLCVCLSTNTSEASRMEHTECMNSSFPCLSKRNSALRSYSAFLSRGRSHIQIYSIRCQPLIFPPWNQVARKHHLYRWDKRANYSNLETWSHPIHPNQLLLGQISPPNLETQCKSNHLFCWQIWIHML